MFLLIWMNTMKTYKVDSISKYLSILEDVGIEKFIYRGQNEPYYSIQASGFRPYKGEWNSDEIYDMVHLHSSFYNKIISKLSENEKIFFIFLSTPWNTYKSY